MKLHITNAKGTFNAIQIAPTVRWSGDYQQCARTLGLSLLSSPTDKTIPVVDCPLGAAVQMIEGGETLFDGFVFSRTKSTQGSTIDLACFDRGFYLKKNKAHYKFTGATPEAIVAKLAADFNFQVGYVAPTGISVTRLFITGKDSLYDIMATAYTLASKTNGKQYHIGFRGAKLFITVKEPDSRTNVIKLRLCKKTVSQQAEISHYLCL